MIRGLTAAARSRPGCCRSRRPPTGRRAVTTRTASTAYRAAPRSSGSRRWYRRSAAPGRDRPPTVGGYTVGHAVPQQDPVVGGVRHGQPVFLESECVREPEPVTGVRTVRPFLRAFEIRLPEQDIGGAVGVRQRRPAQDAVIAGIRDQQQVVAPGNVVRPAETRGTDRAARFSSRCVASG